MVVKLRFYIIIIHMTDSKIKTLESMVARADILVAELETICERDLQAQDVSDEILNITHEIVEKCSNVLDQAMTLYFERNIAPLLTEKPKRGGYFPAARDERSYRSTMGQWKASNLDKVAPDLDAKLRSLQPFSAESNIIYARIRELASKKHTSLEPQVKHERRQVSVTRPGAGGVSWRAGVRFGHGVSVMGVPIDPHTQMPAHNRGIDVSEVTWVSFHFKYGGEDSLAFCRQAPKAARHVLKTLFV